MSHDQRRWTLRAQDLVEALSFKSDDFRRLWAKHDVLSSVSGSDLLLGKRSHQMPQRASADALPADAVGRGGERIGVAWFRLVLLTVVRRA